MDHIRISGTEHSSGIISKKSIFNNLKVMSHKSQDKLKQKGMVW